jgi:hypothetical protein
MMYFVPSTGQTATTALNEGAECGAQALSGIAGVQLPDIPFEGAVLGNIWDGTNMMGGAIWAYHNGFPDQAIDAAICSQIHNNDAHQLLSDNRNIVGDWLSNH